MTTMKHLISSAAAKIAALTLGCAALCASTVHAAGFDGKPLTTNDWFDVGFSSVAANTAIAANSTTGITRGAGSWTAVPTSGEAVVLSDKTLSIDADSDEALTLTPVASLETGMETIAVKIKANVSTSLETLTDSPIAAFAIYTDDMVVKPAAYVSGGWTNLVYANVTDLTNGWFTLYIDYANVDNVKSVRFSVQPEGGTVAVLPDAQGATWFPTDSSATKISSLSFTGSGFCETISGDSIGFAVAEVNGVRYESFEAAITAADAAGVSTITILNGAAVSPNADWKVVNGQLVKKVYVAQIGANKYETLDAAFAAANATAGSETITIMILQASVSSGAATITHNLLIDTELAGGATINFNSNSFTAQSGAVVTFSDAVTAAGNVDLNVVGGSPVVENAKLVLNNTVAASGMTVDVNGGEIVINPTARVTLGGSESPIFLAVGNITVNGSLNEGEAQTVTLAEVAGEQQLSGTGGYFKGFFGKNIVTLNNTFVSTAWVDYSGYTDYSSYTQYGPAYAGYATDNRFILTNSVLYITDVENQSNGFNLGGFNGVLSLTGSRLISNGSPVVFNAGDVANLDVTSSITAKTFTNNGVINIDATGIDAPVKVIDYIGSGAKTLADYGTVNVTGGEAYVEDNDLWIKKLPVAQIGSTKYETLAAAIAAAVDGDTIELLSNVVWDGTGSYCQLNASGSVTIDGKGFTLSAPVTGGPTDSAIMLGDSGSSGSASVYTVTNMTFSGFTTISHSVLRAQGVRATIVDCTFTGNGSTGGEWAVVTANNGADVTVKDCLFSGNTGTKCVDVGFNVPTGSSLAVDNCLFENNNLTGHGVIYVAGDITAASVHNSTFSGNTVLSPEPTPDDAKPNAAVVYCSGVTSITGCLFTNNTVKAYGKEGVVVLGSSAENASVTGNAFVDNTLSTERNPAHYATLYVSKTCNLSGNYWGDGAAPAEQDQQDIYNSGSATLTVDPYATAYTVVGNGVTVTLYVPPVAAVITDNGATTNTYATFAAAISAARTNGGTVALLADIEVAGSTGGIDISGLTIDGNGYTVTGVQGDNSVIFSGENVTVSNLKLVAYENAGWHLMLVKSGTFTNCEFTGAPNAYSANYIHDESGIGKTLTFSYCTFKNFPYTYSTTLSDDEADSASHLIIDHCTFINVRRPTIMRRADTFSNNTVEGFYKFNVMTSTSVITGNTFDKGDLSGTICFYERPAVAVSGNDFSAVGGFDNGAASILTADDPLNLVDNIWGDYDKSTLPVGIIAELPSYVAQIIRNNAVFAQYETLASAIAAAQDGDTIELLTDVEIAEPTRLNKVGTYVIDGKGFTISPAPDANFAADGALGFGPSGGGVEADIATKIYTLKNTTLSGFGTNEIIRCETCALTVDGCTFTGNALSVPGYSEEFRGNNMILFTGAAGTVMNCVFSDNTVARACIDFNSQGGENNKCYGVLTVTSNTFTNNTGLTQCVIYSHGSLGTSDAVTDNTFVDNNVSAGSSAIVYCSGAIDDISGNLFKGNALNATSDKCGIMVLGSKGTGTAITGNAFVNNQLTSVKPTGLVYANDSKDEYSFDVSGNYWGAGVAATVAVNETANVCRTTNKGTLTNVGYAVAYKVNKSGRGVTVTIGEAYTATFTSEAPTGVTDLVLPNAITFWNSGFETALPTPTYDSITTTFAGWKVGGTGDALAALPAGTEGDVTLVATWKVAKTISVITDDSKPEETTPIKVAEDWIAQNVTNEVGQAITDTKQIASALNETADNGLKVWENYVIGQDPTTAVAVGAEQGETTVMPVSNTLAAQPVDTGFTVEYSLKQVDTNGTEVATVETKQTTDFDIDLSTVKSNAYYTMTATIKTGNEVVSTVTSTNVIGVLAVTNAPATSIVAVPWKGTDGENISVSNLVRTATLTPGDRLQAYDSTSRKYRAWQLSADKTWVPTTVVGGEDATGADACTVSRGEGVWLTRQDPSKPIYLVGDAGTTETGSTVLEKAKSEDKPSWNIVASPSVEPVDAAALLEGKEGDQIIVPTVGAPKNYYYNATKGAWGYNSTEVFKGGVRTVFKTDDTKVPAGTGFWYLNSNTDSGAKITW